jgi:hypothetical protein
MSGMSLDFSELDEESRALQIRSAVRAMRREEIRQRFTRDLMRNWPLAVGLVLACLAPALRDLAASFGPWGMRILLPAVSLVNCLQQTGSRVMVFAGQIALYGQFPLEAVIIKAILRGRVSPGSVAGQLALFHFLGVVLLWLLGSSAA